MPLDGVLVVPTEQVVRALYPGRNEIRDFLSMYTLDFLSWKDDFENQSITTTRFTTITNGAGAAALVVRADQLNGEGRMDAGSADDGYSGASTSLSYRANLNPIIAVRLNLSAVTSVKCEIGFTDSEADAGAVNVLATPSFTATDAAVWVVDTDDTALWQGVGVDTGTGATKQEPSSTEVGPAAATFETLIVALRESTATSNVGVAKYIRLDASGNKTFESAWIQTNPTDGTAPVEGSLASNVLLTPWMFVQNRSATQRLLDIDYIAVWQRRA